MRPWSHMCKITKVLENNSHALGMTYMYTYKYDRSMGVDDSERGSLGSMSVKSVESVKSVVAAVVADKPVVTEAADEVVEPKEIGETHKYTHSTHTYVRIRLCRYDLYHCMFTVEFPETTAQHKYRMHAPKIYIHMFASCTHSIV